MWFCWPQHPFQARHQGDSSGEAGQGKQDRGVRGGEEIQRCILEVVHWAFPLLQVENDDGIWLKLSPESVGKYCDSDTEAWTLAVGLSGRMFLAAEGDYSYTSQLADKKTPEVKKAVFPTAASVFGTTQQSVFSSPAPPVFGGPPVPPVFQFGTSKPVKLQFGSSQEGEPSSTPGPFKFGSVSSTDGGKGKPIEGGKMKFAADKFAGGPKARVHPRFSRRRRRSESPIDSSKPEVAEEPKEEVEEKSSAESSHEEKEEDQQPAKPAPVAKQALSPAVAECQRAIFAAFLWQESLVYDAMASATFLKFSPDLTKELRRDPVIKEEEGEEEGEKPPKAEDDSQGPEEREIAPPAGGEEDEWISVKDSDIANESEFVIAKESSTKDPDSVASARNKSEGTPPTAAKPLPPLLPPTLSHLVTFWDEISGKVTESSSLPFPSPKVPGLAQELQSRYEQEKKEIEKRKKDKDKKAPAPAGGGSTMCELCDQSFPDPVTYHMKDLHPGCGKHANGWGYNSRGTFCSGWAGNCGDGGRGGSTWYLLCKDCHSRYMAMKDDAKKKMVKSVPMPKAKTRKPGKPRNLPVISAIQGMIQNAKFLLEISRSCDSAPPTPQMKSPSVSELSSRGGDLLRQSSTPLVENIPSMDKSSNLPREVGVDSANTSSESTLTDPAKRPVYFRSVSEAVRPAEMPSQKTSADCLDDTPVFSQQLQEESSDQTSPFMLKPSRNLRQLIYKRSRSSPDNKDMGYRRVMAFVSSYHDLDGLRVSMKQSMRVAGVRTFAMEVGTHGVCTDQLCE